MPAQGRLGDKAQIPADAHGCPACPHSAVGPAVSGSPNVNVNGRPALRVGDNGIHAACCGPNTWTAVKGSATVFINKKPAYRMGDICQHCGGVGRLIEGADNVFVGDLSNAGGASPPALIVPPLRTPLTVKVRTDRIAPAESDKTTPKAKVEVTLRDTSGAPLTDRSYRMTLADGSVRTGRTDEKGRLSEAEVPPGEVQVELDDLSMPEDAPEFVAPRDWHEEASDHDEPGEPGCQS